MKQFFIISVLALTFVSPAQATTPWKLKEGMFANSDTFQITSVFSDDGAAAVRGIARYDAEIKDAVDRLAAKRKELHQATGWVSNIEEKKLATQVGILAEELENLEANKLAAYGPKATERANDLKKKAARLGEMLEKSRYAYGIAESKGQPLPKKSAAFVKLENEVYDDGKKLWSIMEKFYKADLAARPKSKGKVPPSLEVMKKAGLLALPIAAGAALMGTGSGPAEARTIRHEDFSEAQAAGDDRSNVEIDVIGVIDAE